MFISAANEIFIGNVKIESDNLMRCVPIGSSYLCVDSNNRFSFHFGGLMNFVFYFVFTVQ